KHSSNPISMNAGCELFIAFVALFPDDAISGSFSELKMELVRQGEIYVRRQSPDAGALTCRRKIGELAFDFIKADLRGFS
ncbi:hypothetical protein C8R44DRAFT_624518, partial [Mycena epipterygia]